MILYGCGDLLNDYEGISGYEQFRADLALMYLPRLSVATGELAELRMVPMQIKRFRTVRATREDVRWLAEVLIREGAKFNTRVAVEADDSLRLVWERK